MLLLLLLLVPPTGGCLSSSSSIVDPRSFLGGDIAVDWLSPVFRLRSLLGQFKISYPSDLNCDSFDVFSWTSCRWRNEWLGEGEGVLPWGRLSGQWTKGEEVFGTAVAPRGHFLLTGTPRALPPDHSALLVSDPIQCLQADARVSFRYWTSPGVKIRVCTRQPSQGKRFDWCSEDVSHGDPGPATITIPGSIQYTHEVVIEARNFVFDAFGHQGGVAAIDDVTYNAEAVYNCRQIAHRDPLPSLNSSSCSPFSCLSFDSPCPSMESEWIRSSSAVGPFHSGIRQPLKGGFVYATGPGTATMAIGPFSFPRPLLLELCYYLPAHSASISIHLTREGSEERRHLFTTDPVAVHGWRCSRVEMEGGRYSSLEMTVDGLSNEYSYGGLDEVSLVDGTGRGLCSSLVLSKGSSLGGSG